MMKALIEEGTKVRKLLGPIGMGTAGITETGVVGIVGSATVLGSSGMFVTTRQE